MDIVDLLLNHNPDIITKTDNVIKCYCIPMYVASC